MTEIEQFWSEHKHVTDEEDLVEVELQPEPVSVLNRNRIKADLTVAMRAELHEQGGMTAEDIEARIAHKLRLDDVSLNSKAGTDSTADELTDTQPEQPPSMHQSQGGSSTGGPTTEQPIRSKPVKRRKIEQQLDQNPQQSMARLMEERPSIVPSSDSKTHQNEGLECKHCQQTVFKGQGGRSNTAAMEMWVCDSCDTGHHKGCLGITFKGRQDWGWYCPACIQPGLQIQVQLRSNRKKWTLAEVIRHGTADLAGLTEVRDIDTGSVSKVSLLARAWYPAGRDTIHAPEGAGACGDAVCDAHGDFRRSRARRVGRECRARRSS